MSIKRKAKLKTKLKKTPIDFFKNIEKKNVNELIEAEFGAGRGLYFKYINKTSYKPLIQKNFCD